MSLTWQLYDFSFEGDHPVASLAVADACCLINILCNQSVPQSKIETGLDSLLLNSHQVKKTRNVLWSNKKRKFQGKNTFDRGSGNEFMGLIDEQVKPQK